MKANIITCVILALLFSSCNTNKVVEQELPISESQFILDTLITLTFYDNNDKNIMNQAFDLCRKYEDILSSYKEESDIYKINNANGQPVEVDNSVIELLKASINYSEMSDGKFDVTVGSVSLLWDFTGDGLKPADSVIEENIKYVDYKNIKIDGNKVQLLNKNTKLDLGAIAKGYIADRIKDFLLENNVKSAIINLGGNVVLVGDKYPDNGTFAIGIRKPFEDREEIIGKIDVKDKSIVSSGVYERFFYDNGTFYHHILDTATGMPVINDLLSITIISDKSVDGDAMSTLSFTLGVDESIKFIEQLDNVESILISDKGEIFMTKGIGTTIPFTLKEK